MYEELKKLFQENQEVTIEESNQIELRLSDLVSLIYDKTEKEAYAWYIDKGSFEEYEEALTGEETGPLTISNNFVITEHDFKIFWNIIEKETNE
jgi:hypothetical protein